MKMLWMLAATATLAACAGRGEDDMGAAPDRGDTAVTTPDTTTFDTTGTFDTTTTELPSDTAYTPTEPTVPADTAMTPTVPADTTTGQYPAPADTAQYPTTPADTGMGEYPTTPTDTATGQYPSDTGAGQYPSEGTPDTSSWGQDTSGYSPSIGEDTSAVGDTTMQN